MVDYKLYCLNGRDKIASAHWLKADSDEEAVRKASAIAPDRNCELWLGARKVARLVRGEAELPAARPSSVAAGFPLGSPQSGIPAG